MQHVDLEDQTHVEHRHDFLHTIQCRGHGSNWNTAHSTRTVEICGSRFIEGGPDSPEPPWENHKNNQSDIRFEIPAAAQCRHVLLTLCHVGFRASGKLGSAR